MSNECLEQPVVPITKLSCSKVVNGDPEIDVVEVNIVLKPGISGAAASAWIHERAAALFLADSLATHQGGWINYCVTNSMKTIGV
jgi:hypothetical protein